MATLVVEDIVRTGVEPTYNVAGAGGDEFVNKGKVFLHVVNGATVLNITITTQVVVDGLAVVDLIVNVPENEGRMIGPFPTTWYNDVNGKVQLAYSSEVNVTIAIMKM